MANIVSPDYILINDVSSATVGLYIDTPPMPPMAEQVYTSYETQTQGESTTYATDFYKDITVTITGFVFDGGSDPTKIYGFLNGATRLQTSKNFDFYYKVKQLKGVVPSHSQKGKYKLSIQFVCSPFRWKIANQEQIVLNGGIVENTGTIFSRPVWKLENCNGDVDFYVNGEKLSLFGLKGENIFIDTSRMLVYSGNIIMLDHTNGNLPMLGVGNNSVSWKGNVSSVLVTKNERSV